MNRSGVVHSQTSLWVWAWACVCALLLVLSVNSVSQAVEPVWPGSETRFYPGIYPRVAGSNPTVADVKAGLDMWWGNVDRDVYREYYNGQRVSHIGARLHVWWEDILSDYWFNHETGPYDYATHCDNSPLMQDPDAVLEGHPIYDWSFFDGVLALPEVVSGEYKFLVRFDDQDIRGARWWWTQGIMMTNSTNGTTQPKKYDWVYARLKMDMLKAFATRYAGNPAIAGVEMEEYPGVEDVGPVCGYVVPDQRWQVSAENGTKFYPAKAMLEADPGLMIFFVAPSAFAGPEYFTGVGTGLGFDDLPGIQGVGIQDVKFWDHECGNGPPGTVDCYLRDWGYYWMAQQAWVRDDLPVLVHNERNGWTPRVEAAKLRMGDENPWGVAQWPATDAPWDGENVGGVDDGTHRAAQFPDPMFWVWYTSGAPRATGAAADSGLGQEGPDPPGVFPSLFYDSVVPWCATPGCVNPASWNGTNLSAERFRAAYRVFGPQGTKAMFHYPPGYLEQFTADGVITAREPAVRLQFVLGQSGAGQRLQGPTPLRLDMRLGHGVTLRQIQVRVDEKEIYRGEEVPDGLVINRGELAEGGHTLEALVTTDDAGEHRFTRTFAVQNLSLQVPEPGAGHGAVVPVRVDLALPADAVKRVEVRLDGATIYEGPTLPQDLSIDTMEIGDGEHEVRVSVTTATGLVLEAYQKLRVRNWWTLLDGLDAPVPAGWFGVVDLSKTSGQSGGWSYATDSPAAFQGDPSRRVRTADTEEYLEWRTPGLRSFRAVVFAREAQWAEAGADPAERFPALAGEVVSFVARDSSDVRHELPFNVEVGPLSDAGWRMLTLAGDVPTGLDVASLRLVVEAGKVAAESLQVGSVEMTGPEEWAR